MAGEIDATAASTYNPLEHEPAKPTSPLKSQPTETATNGERAKEAESSIRAIQASHDRDDLKGGEKQNPDLPKDVKTAISAAEGKKGKNKDSQGVEHDSASDSDVGGVDDFINGFVLRNADKFTSKSLYDIYSKKLESDDRKRKKKTEKAPRLVRGFADYLRTLEDRLVKLEMKTNKKSEPQEKKPKTNAKPATEGFSIQTVFYNCANEKSVIFVHLTRDERWKERGTFTSEVDQQHFLRVLYKSEGEQSEFSEGVTPGQDIDVLALRLYSKPIGTFLEKLVHYPVHKDNLILMTKPFRLLIQNASAIKDQLKRLETRYSPRVEKDCDTAANENLDQSETINTHARETQTAAETEVQLNAPEASQKPYDSTEALQHFREIAQFIDTYLSEQMRLYNDLRSGVQIRAAFENLWMLYEPHDTILCPTQKGGQQLFKFGVNEGEYTTKRRDVPQAYRVLASSGGITLYGQLIPLKVKSGEIIFREDKDTIQSQTERPFQRAKDKYSSLYIHCYSMDYDGTRFRPFTATFAIKPYEGEADITSLEVYPIRYRAEQQSSTEALNLTERGLKFINYTAVTHLQYEGLTLGGSRQEINGPVVIDLEQANQENNDVFSKDDRSSGFWSKRVPASVLELAVPSCTDSPCHEPVHLCDTSVAYDKSQSAKTISELGALLDDYVLDGDASKVERLKQEMEQHGLLELLPGSVHGFALRDRKWLEFDINLLQKVQENDDESGWSDLVLPENHRAMVQSMVETHSAGTKASNTRANAESEIGLVQGKGKGCIILLHGVPGVGKTSTAECVAAYTKRPLFPITCGDIGYEPVEVERNLQNMFKLAHRWGCVLLIDEADVFLAERDKSDIKRNGLVSVFLRILEYYSGILFLTTNRVGAFDDAFRSRIHLTLYYPKLDEEQSYRVWETNIKRVARLNKERVKDGLPKIKIHKDRILRFAELNYETLQWNGRQIQNAFQTALALARFKVRKTPEKRPEITIEHFETIAKASIQFDSYLKEVHLGDEAKNAKKKGVRADNLRFDAIRKVQLPPGTKSKRGKVEEEESTTSEAEESSTNSSEAERKRRKAKAKAKAKRKAKATAKEGDKEKSDGGEKLKKASKRSDGEDDKAGQRSSGNKKSRAKKRAEDNTSTESDSSGV